ncbi:pyrophosphohydrolase domain-containing protein [Paenibacillus caseinilyticus]|uniref:Phosphoribosyl-ATP pyrophosphohydrolase n=1 Tax=Paenibacillus mucilaginosus K02 TaxID=997761 RepID=I0BB95_9BACL|nr:nucleoside triphosphate pyrophosphohydrolase [Paenibacillus mucilaginosus]AFH59642.1 phosphoribosyl-ATP pyrophosphohydrolase [Paenibacillus mucilaginosus K02]
MIIYNKLVRDKIPQIIEATGKKANIKVLDDKEYEAELDAKLLEELKEYTSAPVNEKVEELADLVELVYAILDNKGISIDDFEKVRIAKQEKRGAFKERLYLLSVE